METHHKLQCLQQTLLSKKGQALQNNASLHITKSVLRELNQLGNDALPHLTSHHQISSNILTAFTVASRMQKAFPRTLLNPRAGILYTAEQTYFTVLQDSWGYI